MTERSQGVLKAQFIYADEIANASPALKAVCPVPAGASITSIAGFAAEIGVIVVGKAVESLIDSVAARAQPEATILDTTFPLPGYYKGDGSIAVQAGCLVFHNASKDDLSDASILMSSRLLTSFDGTAFHFQVWSWKFDRFLKPKSTSWIPLWGDNSLRDVAIKIEFLSPGSLGLGTRAVFVEHLFPGTDVAGMSAAFTRGQDLPWLSAPQKPSYLPVNLASVAASGATAQKQSYYLPLNIRITVVETTKPNLISQWLLEAVKDKKQDISAALKDAVRKTVDETYGATDKTKQADLASTAFVAYKTAWDGAVAHKVSKPKPPTGADPTSKDKYDADMKTWRATFLGQSLSLEAKRTLARSAFAAAGVPWPGDLPTIEED